MNYNFSQKTQKYKDRLKRKGLHCLILALCFNFFVPVQAQLQQLTEKVTLHLRQTTAQQIIEEADRQSRYAFLFAPELLGRVAVDQFEVTEKPLGEVLNLLQKKYGLLFSITDNNISVKPGPKPESKPTSPLPKKDPGKVTGKIIDEENGQPVEGATIRIGNKGVTSGIDGSFSLSLPKGSYTATVSYIGYGTKEVSEITVKDNEVFPLNITLKREKGQLVGVTVKASAKKESINALYARQKNEAGISNGISQEQISALPDKNVGETLKRISGVSTNDNRQVVVRGIAERYNLAMMDGATLPSTDVQVRDFEFDIIPSNLIDNVVVSKTSTPDMSFGFGGGLVQINTMAIPSQNFTTIGFGAKYIQGSTGKDFLGYGRGKNDYLGFDDGTRDHFPKELLLFTGQNYNPSDPNAPVPAGVTKITPEMIAAQNKKIGGLERMGTRIYKTMPGQNYQFSLGRSYNIRNSRLGFVGSVSYRNEQSIDDVSQYERGIWQKIENYTYTVETGKQVNPTTANQYNFNTTWAALLNAGWSSKNHKITIRNFYTRLFSNQFSRIMGWANDIGYSDNNPAIREYDRPRFIDMLQNRINGEHSFGNFKFDWNLARNKLVNLERDAVEAWLAPSVTLNETVYNVTPSGITNPGLGTFNRSQYRYEETNHIAEGALSYSFKLAKQKQTAKVGYQYLERHGTLDWTVLPIGAVNTGVNTVYPFVPVQNWGQFLDFNDPQNDLFYFAAPFSQTGYEGKNTNQAWYAMLDNRLTNWMRLVWGIRGEYFKYERLKSGTNDLLIDRLIANGAGLQYVDPGTGKLVSPFADPTNEEKTWRFLPSASLTLTPLKDFNIRAAYS